jgi:hypothetical protein
VSTPHEIYDQLTGDSIFVDEYGLVGISVQPHKDKELRYHVELTLDSVIELIRELSDAAWWLRQKEKVREQRGEK